MVSRCHLLVFGAQSAEIINIYITMNSGTQEKGIIDRMLRMVLPYSPSSSLQLITKSHHYRWAVNCSDDYKLSQCMTSKFGRCLSKYECALESVSHIRASFIKHVMAAKGSELTTALEGRHCISVLIIYQPDNGVTQYTF